LIPQKARQREIDKRGDHRVEKTPWWRLPVRVQLFIRARTQRGIGSPGYA
jgi:hypothetical protein